LKEHLRVNGIGTLIQWRDWGSRSSCRRRSDSSRVVSCCR
jgi:hypothetical protein